jgi:hypothetical protein
MKRREALKNLGLATGFVVATPSIISLLQSCTSDANTWTPVFLSVEEGVVLTNIVDIILPKTDIPSATEVNVPQFIDKYIDEVLMVEDQAKVKTAFGTIISILKPNAETKIEKVTQEDYKALLDNHMLIKDEIDQEREANPESKDITKSEFLNNLKWMTINAYKTTQEIGENVLAYDPVPGAYYCGDLQELTGGKSWSL